MFPVECVARGYLTGSGLAEYLESSSVCGVALPPGLKDGSELPKPIFTPATKAALGDHDENVTFDEVVAAIGAGRRRRPLRRLTLAVYDRAAAIAARPRPDPGRHQARVRPSAPTARTVLADEVLTPDSVALLAGRHVGARPPAAVLRQAVRPRLADLAGVRLGPSSGEAPPPLPDEVVERTRAKYVEAYERLTGKRFS